MNKIINLPLMSNPLNWGVVWVVLLLTAYAFTTITHGLTKSGGCGCGSPNASD